MEKALKVVVMVLLIFLILNTMPVNGVSFGWVAINGAKYRAGESQQPVSFNVSQNIGNSKLGLGQSVALDSKGYPHIVWYDDTTGNNEIYYVRWNENNWVCSNGERYNPETGNANISKSENESESPILEIDEFDNPHISWCEEILENSEIHYVKWNGDFWVNSREILYDSELGNANISSNSGNSKYPSLKLDDENRPHLTWEDTTNGRFEIFYTRLNENNDWVCADGSNNSRNICDITGNSFQPQLALDSKNNPHIVWLDRITGDHEIFYLRWSRDDWVCADGTKPEKWENLPNVSRNTNISKFPSLAIDSKDNPHISWQENSISKPNFEIKYVRWNEDNWICANGNIYKSNGIDENVKTEKFEHHSVYPSLVLDSEDNPHISWCMKDEISSSLYGNMIRYKKWDGLNWVCTSGEIGDSDSCELIFPVYSSSLTLDDDNNPHIVWHGGSKIKPDIFYAKWEDEITDCYKVLRFKQDSNVYSVDGVKKGPMETTPVIIFDRLYLPVKYITDEIPKTEVEWLEFEKKIIITTFEGKRIELQIGNKDAVINGQTMQIDKNNPEVVPFISAGRTHCPMRFIAEQLGATGENDISWLPETKTVELRFSILSCGED